MRLGFARVLLLLIPPRPLSFSSSGPALAEQLCAPSLRSRGREAGGGPRASGCAGPDAPFPGLWRCD
eukprot:6492320-Pyramimonas_sp.AAC.1